MMTPKDMNKATIGQLGNRDIPSSKCGIRVYTFKCFGVKRLRQRLNTAHWRDRQIYLEREYLVGMINPLA